MKKDMNLLKRLNNTPLDIQKLILKKTDPFELDIKSLGAATANSWAYQPLYHAARAVFPEMAERKKQLQAQADQLKDYTLHYRYDDASALLESCHDKRVLEVPCDYKINRWLKDKDIIREGALSHAWRTGDPNFMALFEKHGKHLRHETWAAKDGLLQTSGIFCTELADANSRTADPLWARAPLWLLGLDKFVYDLCYSRYGEQVSPEEVNVLSDEFRDCAASVQGAAWARMWWGVVSPHKPSLCASIRSHARYSSSEAAARGKVLEESNVCKIM